MSKCHRGGFLAGSLLALCAVASSTATQAASNPPLTPQTAGQFALLALNCVHLEYPNKLSHTLQSDADALPPHRLTPAFYGCYDWHSAVHGHWLLARLARLYPDAPFAPKARAALDRTLSASNIAAELQYLQAPGRAPFERPYGLAWLLQLSAELRSWDDPEARRLAANLAPLEAEAAAHIASWLSILRYPIRVGEHSQTAFAFGLIWDWARVAGRRDMRDLLNGKSRQYYLNDRNCPIAFEPSGEDFLSPCLAEADLMRRTLDGPEFSRWLTTFLPSIPSRPGIEWLAPGIVTDRSDPKLAHIDGLNLSRAWMLEGIASALTPNDRRIQGLRETAAQHRAAALPAVTGERYEGGHWLGTFAVYLTSEAGQAQSR